MHNQSSNQLNNNVFKSVALATGYLTVASAIGYAAYHYDEVDTWPIIPLLGAAAFHGYRAYNAMVVQQQFDQVHVAHNTGILTNREIAEIARRTGVEGYVRGQIRAAMGVTPEESAALDEIFADTVNGLPREIAESFDSINLALQARSGQAHPIPSQWQEHFPHAQAQEDEDEVVVAVAVDGDLPDSGVALPQASQISRSGATNIHIP